MSEWGQIVDIPDLNETQGTNWTHAVTGSNYVGDRIIGRIILMLKSVQDPANYTCVASSTLKTINFSTEVLVLAKPKVSFWKESEWSFYFTLD